MNTKHPNISLSPVKSSQVDSIGHDAATNTLAVKFKTKDGKGSTYHYPGVSAAQFAELQKAESVGSHVNKHFVRNKHPFTKIPAPVEQHA